jgi:PLP dependent protein
MVASAESAFPPAAASGSVLAWADVAGRLRQVRARMDAAAARSGRSPDAVTLVAVSKEFPSEAILAARAAGQMDFGENRAQALERKADALGAGAVRWHFVGRLQRNKAAGVVARAALIHSVDRLPLVRTIADAARARQRVQPVLLQVNVGADPAKGGCAPAEVPALLAAMQELDGIRCTGLMTMPPLGVDPRPPFRALRALRDELAERHPGVRHLSMGMTNDFEVAVEEGATIVRLGEAVFGPRPPR